MPLSQVYEKRGNPRIISDRNFQKLIDSVLVFPKMMGLRPVVIDDTNSSLGGNMRLRALNTIAQMSYEKIKKRLAPIKDYSDKTDKERKQIRDYWQKWLQAPYVETLDAADLTEDERKQFIIKDNVSMGEWDWQELMQNWDTNTLETWGVDAQLPEFGEGENPFEQGGGKSE